MSRIELVTLQNPKLRMVFNSELEALKDAFMKAGQDVQDARDFKYELMLAFWLAVELDKLEEAQALISVDPLIEKIILNLRENGYIMRKAQRRLIERRRLKNMGFISRADRNNDDDEEDVKSDQSSSLIFTKRGKNAPNKFKSSEDM